jgi:hypothetical protein
VKLTFLSRLAALLTAIWALSCPLSPAAHANQICSPGLGTLVVHEPMSCEEGVAIENALGSHPYQTQFFIGGRVMIECETNYATGRWVVCHDGPGWASFEL